MRKQLNVIHGMPDGGVVLTEATKTRNGFRQIGLDRDTVAVLRSQHARQGEQKLALGAGWHKHDFCFTDADGARLDPESVAKRFNRRVERSGLPRLRWHDLQHSAAAFMIAAGIPLLVISRRLGHGSISVTADIYGHLLPEADAEAAQRAADFVARA